MAWLLQQRKREVSFYGKRRPQRYLVVSLHDVTPVYFSCLQYIVGHWQEIGLSVFVLKVIPNFAGQADIRKSESFISWLRHLQDLGCEIVLHGWEHILSRPCPDAFFRPALRLLTKDEDEFSCLSQEEARGRLVRGREIMDQLGLNCVGFTAPTWRMSRGTRQALCQAGFLYLTTYTQLIDLAGQRRFFSPAFGHQGIPSWLETMMKLGNKLGQFIFLPHLSLVRVVFHPRGIDHPNFAAALKLVAFVLRWAKPTTYARFLKER